MNYFREIKITQKKIKKIFYAKIRNEKLKLLNNNS